MSEVIFLFTIAATDTHFEIIRINKSDLTVTHPRQTLEITAIAELCREHETFLIIPGTRCTLRTVAIPARSQAEARAAIPFALEESLAEDIEELHFASAKINGSAEYAVAICLKDELQGLINNLNAHGIFPDAVYSESSSVPFNPDCITVIYSKTYSHIRYEPNRAYTFESEFLVDVLKQMLEQHPYPIKMIITENEVFTLDNELPSASIHYENISLDVKTKLCLTLLKQETPLNLLQGALKSKRKKNKKNNLYRMGATLAAIWLGVVFIGNLVLHATFSHQEKNLDQKIANLYYQVFPHASSVISPKIRIEQKLSALTQGQTDHGFLALLNAAGEIIKPNHDVVIRQMAFNNDQLTVKFEAINSNAFIPIVKALKSQGLSVSQKSNLEAKAKVSSTLVISERPQR